MIAGLFPKTEWRANLGWVIVGPTLRALIQHWIKLGQRISSAVLLREKNSRRHILRGSPARVGGIHYKFCNNRSISYWYRQSSGTAVTDGGLTLAWCWANVRDVGRHLNNSGDIVCSALQGYEMGFFRSTSPFNSCAPWIEQNIVSALPRNLKGSYLPLCIRVLLRRIIQ